MAIKTVERVIESKLENMKPEPFLVIDNVSKIYDTANGPYIVLDGVDLAVEEGEFVCIIGHSGCGKSTLLNMVSGFNQPTYGSVSVQGKIITEPGPDRMVVFQNYSLLPWLTAEENIHLGVESVYGNKSKEEQLKIVKEHLELVGLTDAAQKRPTQISGGMKQRVAIARALATRPQLLILDEPFGALDPITREELQEELLKIWRSSKVTVLMITHDIDEALFLSDKIVMMTNGPAAKIGEVLEIPFKRPRDRSSIMEDPKYYELRNYALDFLFRRFAHDEIEEETEEATTTVTEKSPLFAPEDETEKSHSNLAQSATNTPLVPSISQSNNAPDSANLRKIGLPQIMVSVASLAALFCLSAWQIRIGLNAAKEANQKGETTTPALVSSPTPTPINTTPPVVGAPVPNPISSSPVSSSSVSPSPISPSPVSPSPVTLAKITDSVELATAKQKLFEKIDRTWQTIPTFTQDLIYQVKVNGQGEVLSYESVNQSGQDYLKEIPLGDIISQADIKESYAEFKVIFTPGGILKIE